MMEESTACGSTGYYQGISVLRIEYSVQVRDHATFVYDIIEGNGSSILLLFLVGVAWFAIRLNPI